MHNFIADLYPRCRSITGEGVRETSSDPEAHPVANA
jgi:aminopeptidase-like protein